MAKEIRHHFTVEGRGPFPIDMLRYDRCWPERESPDSAGIYATFEPRISRTADPFKINVVGLNPPTAARWHSFGWSVITQRKVTLV